MTATMALLKSIFYDCWHFQITFPPEILEHSASWDLVDTAKRYGGAVDNGNVVVISTDPRE